jgi:hypothetical protein
MTLKLQPFEVEEYIRGKGTKIRRRGHKAEIETCPFCAGGDHHDRWTCVVYLDQTGGNFKCMRGSCGRTGSFWQMLEHYGDDPKDFYQRDFTKPRPSRTSDVLRPAHFPYKSESVEPMPLTTVALIYLQTRGFSEDVLDHVSIWCDREGNINFGYYHRSQLCNVKVRYPRKPKADEPKAWQKWAGGLRPLWGIEQCDPSIRYIVITFGEYDRIACKQAGIPNAVSVPCGDEDLEWINICWDELQRYQEIYLWIDNDAAGQKALPRIAERLGIEKIKVIRTPYKDANEMLVMRGREVADEVDAEMFNAVATAEWYFDGHLIQLADVKEAERCFDGYTSGIGPLDKALGGFFFTQLIAHTGDTKHGKSAGVNQIAAHAIAQGGTVCFWPGEDSTDDFKYKMYIHVAGFNGVEIKRSPRTGTEYASLIPGISQRIDEFMRDRLIVLDLRAGITEEILIDNFKLAFQRFGCDTFIVDNLMKIVAGKDSENINFRQARIVNALSDFAKTYRVTVHLVTHTNKTGSDTEPPTKKNVSGAKEIINLADRVIGWWRIPDEVKSKYGQMETLISVLAERVFGNEMSVAVRYDKTVRRYGSNVDELCVEYFPSAAVAAEGGSR